MKLTDVSLILASGSPRRIEILQNEGAVPVIIRPGCKEDIHLQLDPAQTVMTLALRKGLSVRAGLSSEYLSEASAEKPLLILSCDTIVCLDGQILGKPADEDDARRMLRLLRGRKHSVISGVCLQFPVQNRTLLFYDETFVFVKDYTDAWIATYIRSGEPMDKAGAYAIQGGFGCNIERIAGSYSNVVGLPIEKIKEVLQNAALTHTEPVQPLCSQRMNVRKDL